MLCTKCALHKTRRNIVIGRGIIPADVLFIGEAPGKSEDMLSEPFVGAAGKILDALIKKILLPHKKIYYITNTVFCRPCEGKDEPNREPFEEEVLACRENVLSKAKEVNPKLIIFLGKIAEKYYQSEFPNSISLQHPAFILRQGGINSPAFNVALHKLKDAVKQLEE